MRARAGLVDRLPPPSRRRLRLCNVLASRPRSGSRLPLPCVLAMEDSLAESFNGDEQEAAAADAPAAEPAHYPAIQISRRFTISVHMVWGLTCLLMLRAIPSFVMQTPDLKGMGDPGQILDRPFTNVEKATILAAWGWGYCGCQ